MVCMHLRHGRAFATDVILSVHVKCCAVSTPVGTELGPLRYELQQASMFKMQYILSENTFALKGKCCFTKIQSHFT